MNPDNQQAFLGRIKRALNIHPGEHRRFGQLFPGRSPETVRGVLKRIQNRGVEQRQALLDQLRAAAKPINMHVTAQRDVSAVAKAVAGIARQKKPEWGQDKQIVVWRHPLIERLKLAETLNPMGIPLSETDFRDIETEAEGRERMRRQVAEAFIGVTSADYCVADSATLVMKTRPGRARSVSLLPGIHIAVIHSEQIIADLNELYVLLEHEPGVSRRGLTNCLTFISGPSKTADIEAEMVHGAHGPRELHLFVITGRPR